MSDYPFHVAGGSFPAAPRPLDPFQTVACRPVAEAAKSPHASRRHKLWELAHKFHCPVIGVCFAVDELRGLMDKVVHIPRGTSDYMLHTSAVGACDERGPLADLLQKTMEKRYALTIRRFAAAKNSEALRALWQDAVRSGSEIPAALWAGWTHPDCDATLEQEIYGDIHMLQHQIGSGARTQLGTLKNLGAEIAELRRQLDAARRDNEALRAEKVRETRTLGQCIADLRVELAGKDAWGANLSAQLEQLRQSLPELKARQALARRANDAESRATALAAHAARLEQEVAGLRRQLGQADEAQRQAAAGEGSALQPAVEPDPGVDVAGKCVLCVGGRSGAVDAYRRMIEQHGGRFLHHDGGQEESMHRIDSALAAADLVICQAGCISHNAYWRVKEQCKRTGKPCLYMKSSGVSGFSRLISRNDGGQRLPTA
ncbi:MAG: DUF2325 domain-containing protein [Dechloromonas sp.]|nr:DUF2325 domain-containing protein [Dechloromonas sp.]